MGRVVRLGRFGIGMLALALAALPAAAQNVVVVPSNDGPAPTDVVGPPQLRDFNLNGRVTRPADTPATTTRPAPVQTPRPAKSAPTQAQPQPNRSAPATAAPRAEPRLAPVQAAPDTPAPVTVPASPQIQQPEAAPPPVAALPEMPLPGEAGTGFTLWPWILAGLVAAGGALFLFRRQQLQRERYAGAVAGEVGVDLGPAPMPAPEPLQRAPVPAPPPPKPASTGIVSTRLRPDLAIELLPERAVVDESGATIEFQVAVRNNGSAPAREVKIEACMVNAGPAQDQELGAFFARPNAAGDSIPHIAPMTEILLKSAVRLAPEHMRQYEIEGRKLFVPLVGLNAVYRGAAGPAQTSASYFVGRDGNGEKMAPFRLDLGPRIFRGLGARQHTAGLRT